MPVRFDLWLGAAAPIVLLLVLMLGLKWGATRAAPLALLLTCVTSLLLFRGNVPLLGMAFGKGIWSALVILIVVWPAILIFEITNEARAFDALKAGIERFTPDELIRVMARGWIFSSFLQGITGFGVAVAVCAPLLVGVGVKPLGAVVITLVCHCWGATFGTLSLAWQALMTQSGLAGSDAVRAAFWAAVFIWIQNLVGGVCLCWFYGGRRALRHGLGALLLFSLIQGGGQLALSQINPTLACFIPACVALPAVLLLSRSKRYGTPWRLEDSPIMDRTAAGGGEESGALGFHQAFQPYYVLTAITLVCLLIPPLKAFLEQWRLGFAFPELTTGFGYVNPAEKAYSPLAPLTYPGTFLLAASAAGYLYFKGKGCITFGGGARILRRTVKKTVPSSLAVLSFVIMSRVMGATGQTEVLAQGIAQVMGRAYLAFAPAVGLLGAFMTSSNMASNILFGPFQMATAQLLGLNTAQVLGAQTAGGAIGSAICPGNIILGTTTTGLLGSEGQVLRRLLPIAACVALFCGVLLLLLEAAT